MSLATDPILPGVYTEYNADQHITLPPSPGVTVAVPIVHNWGPVNDPQFFTSLAAWEAVYGTDDSPGRIAVYGALAGEGLEGAGGAGAVLVSRLAGASAAPASVAIPNPAATDAFELSAKFPGTRGNRLSAEVGAVVDGVQEVVILDGTVELESYSFRIADAAALAGLAGSTAASSYSVGSVLEEGVTGLAPGTYALTGGDDGLVLTGADWTSGVEPFQDFDFAFFAPYDLPWSQDAGALAIRTTQSTLQAWRNQREVEGQRFTIVMGGALDELAADAIARAVAQLDPGVLTCGGPGFDDDTFGPLSMSQMAPRIAGIRAQRGEGQSIDMARIAGGTPRPNPTGSRVSLSEVTQMVQAGVVTIQRDRWVVAPTRIVADVNTYQPIVANPDTQPADRPRSIWGNPKFVLSMQQFANDAQAEIEREMIGKTTVNDTTRNAAAARVLRLAKIRERTGAFAPGTIVQPVPGLDTDKFVKVAVSLTFGRALTQLFIIGTVR